MPTRYEWPYRLCRRRSRSTPDDCKDSRQSSSLGARPHRGADLVQSGKPLLWRIACGRDRAASAPTPVLNDPVRLPPMHLSVAPLVRTPSLPNGHVQHLLRSADATIGEDSRAAPERTLGIAHDPASHAAMACAAHAHSGGRNERIPIRIGGRFEIAALPVRETRLRTPRRHWSRRSPARSPSYLGRNCRCCLWCPPGRCRHG